MTCESCGDKPKNKIREFPSAVVEINNPETLVLFRKVVIPISMGDDESIPAAIGKYHNVLLVYEANNHAYLYSSDGIPTLLTSEISKEIEEKIDEVTKGLADEVENRENADQVLQGNIEALDESLATVAKTGSYNDLTNKPTIDTSLNKTSGNAVANSAVSTALDSAVMTDISVNTNTSTTTIQLNESKKNLYSGAISTDNIPLPVASTTQAGVMNSSTFTAVSNNTNNINAIMNGAVAITGLSASPSQSDLTTAWETETGLSTLINRASIYDVTNNKVWTYYANDTTWHAASNTSQVSINTFTNLSEGTIKGSTNVGQIFAENDGTGSVNGWDALSGTVATHTSDIASLQAAIPTVNDATLTIQNNGTNVATFTANSSTNTTANIVSPVDIGSVLSTPSDIAYVNSNNIISNAVTTSKVANGAVTADKIDFSTLAFGNYSLTEQDTGFTWIDGKTIHKKTVDTGALPNNTTKNVAHGINNLSRVIKYEAWGYSPNSSVSVFIPHINTSTASNQIGIVIEGANISIRSGSDQSGFTESYVTLYYTKTS